MFALVDCNNFFVSAERVFRPDLRDKPVCVLSNNDGCVVSLSNEAKAIGIQRGDPLFKIREIVERHHVHVFSSNYTLYAGMSSRVMSILADAADIEIYSIDEAFLHLDGISNHELRPKMLELSRKITQWTGISVSIGIAETKTLAKVAARYAKKYAGYHSVCLIDTNDKRIKALQAISVNDVWGIGRQTVKKLDNLHIRNAYDLSQQPEAWIRQQFTMPMWNTWQELNGKPSIEGNENPDKQSICVSRSFGHSVRSLEDLASSVADFTVSAAQKLRSQHSTAQILTIFITTSRFNEDETRYANCESYKLPVATADTAELIHYAQHLLKHLYRPGYFYKKTGVILSGIMPDRHIQQNIFDNIQDRNKRIKLHQVIDTINNRDGNNTIQYAIQQATEKPWQSKKDFVSHNYLSDINHLMEVK